MKRFVFILASLIATQSVALADNADGPAYPDVMRANIHGLSLGQSPDRVLATLKAQRARITNIEKVLCEKQRLAELRKGTTPGDWPDSNGKCVSWITATSGKATYKIDFVQDVTSPVMPVVAYGIQYTYPQTTDADAQTAINAAIAKYGQPTLRTGMRLNDTDLFWFPVQCGQQTMPAYSTMPGQMWDVCRTLGWDGIPQMVLDTNFHQMRLLNNPLSQRIVKARTAMEARIHSSGVSF